MIRTEKRLRLCICLIAANLCFIWGNSLMDARTSAAFSDLIARIIAWLLPGDGPITEGTGLLRKIAHFTEFAALGMGLTWLLAMLERSRWMALLLGGCAACVDETIQRFVPGRGPSLRDVGIDTCGVAAGIILLSLGYFIYRNRKHNKIGGI